ncbi:MULTISPECIES: aminotransferase class III-fold pyridoxal phosphate-dependent enzyme [unclassified Mesorhizobium]|uniref:aminotransferase class III-fold pyridoxal phosphate-dependent enzyme n=1 Tax=unclassified Mesorhizobium TaxID=325217 RepID=UPI00112EC0E6|nr:MULTISPECIES: aminotransferase class III-fold pyridoxal phosphate-dependent enzyme [unclassified Mesorhizobium]TPN40792.1 aminotransferase class III-fold pyridoxal phosphate-dependent enzyme [Mesorhizobium sp. B1-1-9]TPN45790.1 aminotransferase class III-fold pyridoxal phosphate-dependent enzyme [Mesorhizobium sp. B1-1-7]
MTQSQKKIAEETLVGRRGRLLGAKSQLFYDEPVHLVRGEGVWLYDADGRKYLDAYNNVAHVGHCHPHVVEALCRQASLLNTHSRYLHTAILDYVERLTGTFDASLSTAILTCTGSEANDIALRMAQAASGQMGIIATDATYHGNTTAVSQLSTRMPPVGGRARHVRLVPAPDSFRHPDPMANGKTFGDVVREAIASLAKDGIGLSGMILCPLLANEGFPTLPSGFFDDAVAAVRDAGGLVIADEVQPGFGRTGSHFWGHQRAGFTPDIVTMGKPMGNGHPVAAVVTTGQILATFRDAFRYFNTFGGNPVSCAVASAVLDVIEQENLVGNARDVGAHALGLLRPLADRRECIGEVRGAGLFFGAELVHDRETREPAPDIAGRIINAMRHRGVLVGKTGIHGNVLKIRPPMPFSRDNADLLIATLDEVLEEVGGVTA